MKAVFSLIALIALAALLAACGTPSPQSPSTSPTVTTQPDPQTMENDTEVEKTPLIIASRMADFFYNHQSISRYYEQSIRGLAKANAASARDYIDYDYDLTSGIAIGGRSKTPSVWHLLYM